MIANLRSTVTLSFVLRAFDWDGGNGFSVRTGRHRSPSKSVKTTLISRQTPGYLTQIFE